MSVKIFYLLKKFIPRRLQIGLRRMIAIIKRKKYQNVWPINYNASNKPKNWNGWPEKKQFAFIITHDVDTKKGYERCKMLMNIDKEKGFRSSFNFVPERYKISGELINEFNKTGFEVGVHGLYHDGKLFNSKKIFDKRAAQINGYLKKWNARGFRSPAMHHNLEWQHDLHILYDSSTFDTDPFEPYSDGVGTIFPFFVEGKNKESIYVELPYTIAQDFTLFIIMREKKIDIWKNKLDWIARQGGMALLNVHPDYISFDNTSIEMEEYDKKYYIEFLTYVKEQYHDQYWHVLPRELAAFWMQSRKVEM